MYRSQQPAALWLIGYYLRPVFMSIETSPPRQINGYFLLRLRCVEIFRPPVASLLVRACAQGSLNGIEFIAG